MPSHPQNDPTSCQREDALRFLFGRIDYERMLSMPYDAARMGLPRMRRLLELLGSPDRDIPIVHVAGTKGKGSTAAMIAAILSSAGYRTGLYTSPHLERIEERIAIDGQPCTPEELVELVELVRPVITTLDRDVSAPSDPGQGPTYFEITTAMALLAFARRRVQAAVLEVGLGGRLDATNVCTPRVSVITSISFDHTRQLGETLAAIAGEKAGIIKSGVPVVSGVTEDEPREVIRQVARSRGCRLIELDRDFSFDYTPPRHLETSPQLGRITMYGPENATQKAGDFGLSLPGRHQAANAAVALAAVAELERTAFAIPPAAIEAGLGGLRWPARIEVVARHPTVILDAAHNVASVEALIESLAESFSVRRRLLVFATTHEKDHRGMLARLLGHFDDAIFTQYLNNPRGVPPGQLEAIAFELTGRHYAICATPAEAWQTVAQKAHGDDMICITGSFFIANEMRQQMLQSSHLHP